MVLCCVPNCGTDSWRCDPSITFHDFPSNPDLAAKWIQQINSAIKVKPMWFPRGRTVICSKHFLQTDFKDDSDALKPRCVPTVFGFKYIGQNPEHSNWRNSNSLSKKSPLIVKVIKPQQSVLENDNNLVISDQHSQAAEYAAISNDFEPSMGIDNLSEITENLLPSPSGRAKLTNEDNESDSQFPRKYYSTINPVVNQEKENKDMCVNNVSAFGEIPRTVPKTKFCSSYNSNLKKPRKRERSSNEIIEIGPSTFLKINPDVIKVHKKLTPSGNTVLQFIMDQKLAKNASSDLLPKLIQGTSKSYSEQDSTMNNSLCVPPSNVNWHHSSKDAEKETVVQHVLGHLVDTHVCKESCSDLKLTEDDVLMQDDDIDKSCNEPYQKIFSDTHQDATVSCDNIESNDNADSTCIAKAPVLLTTSVPLSHCFMEKPKYILQLKQKSRQIAALKFKLTSLTKKVEELEDRCIVQERQLSYSFIKRLKTIRKNASKGDPCATYILEQIRGYSRKSKMRWSDSTLSQCAVWCRKAPYAYEYFKKAEFFKLPCLGTVKRFIKKHPELKFQKKINNVGPDDNNDDDESSSDFDFDESDSDEGKEVNDKASEQLSDKTVLSPPSDQTDANHLNQTSQISVSNGSVKINDDNPVENMQVISNNSLSHQTLVQHNLQGSEETDKIHQMPKSTECNSFPIAVDGSNLEVQELILPSGEVVQCYSSNICNGTDVGSQYFIIPNVGEQNSGVDHEYSVVQTDSLPVLLQNYDNSQLPVQQQELIFIANSSEQVECSETEITSA